MALTTLQGYIYKPDGNAFTTGTLFLTLQQDIVYGGQKYAPFTIAIDLSTCNPAGYVNQALVPCQNATPTGVAYFVEFDPDPADTFKPRSMKQGYWSNYWAIPESGSPVNLGNFTTALRGAPSYSYMPIGGTLTNTSETLTLGSTGANSTKYIYANQLAANDPGIRYNHTNTRWEVSNDGTNWYEIPTSVTGLTTGTNFGGDVTGVYNNLQIAAGAVGQSELATVAGLSAGSYGGANSIPVVTVDTKGRVTAISSVAAYGQAHDMLSSTHTDTTQAVIQRGDILTAQGTAPVKWARLAKGTSGQVLRSDGTDALWSAIAADDLPSGIDATKIADGTVTNTEFQYINTVTSNVQTQLDNKAPKSAKYIVQTADATLTAEQALGALATGILKNTTTTGVLSIAVQGDDYAIPFVCIPLGGSRTVEMLGTPSFPVDDYLEFTIDSTKFANMTVTAYVDVRTTNTGTSVQPRIQNVTDGTTAGIGTAYSTDTNWNAQSFAVTLTSGIKRYRLELVTSNATNAVLGIGYLHAV